MEGIQQVSRAMADRIVETFLPLGRFYCVGLTRSPLGGDAIVYIGIDNHSGDAWTEAFDSFEACAAWLLNPTIEVEG